LKGWAPIIASLTLIPSSKGRFEVLLDDELIFSKAALGRHAAPGEVVDLLRVHLGPEIPRE
jgi:selenoprotein W-related protein